MCRDDACADCPTSPKCLCSVHIRIPKIRLLRSRVCIRRPSIMHARYFAVFRPRMRHARHPPLFRRIVSRPVHTYYLYYCIRNSYTQNVLARSAYIFDPSPRQSPFLPNPATTSRCHHSSADRALSDPPDPTLRSPPFFGRSDLSPYPLCPRFPSTIVAPNVKPDILNLSAYT